jgi:hypothetical protein
MAGTTLDRGGVVAGGVAGLAAWVLGYVGTYLVVAPDVRDSGLNRIIEAVQGDPATVDMVGWVFYNAHLAETVVADVPLLGTTSLSFVGGDGGFTPLLYALPPLLLLVAGLAAGRYQAPTSASEGVVAGLTVLPGYLLASAVGASLFRLRVGAATIFPDLIPAVFVAGVAYPLLFAGAGGALSVLLSGR